MTMTLPVHSISTSITPSGQCVSASKPSFIEHGNYRFVIVDQPTDETIGTYLQCFKKKNVVAVARCCEPGYSAEPLIAANIKVVDIPYADGDAPPRDVIDRFINLVYETFGPPVKPSAKDARKSSFDKDARKCDDSNKQTDQSIKPSIAIHCVAGLGRAPCLVAIALMEHGLSVHTAVEMIRKKRRGAINTKQLAFLERYTPVSRNEACCTIM